MGGPLARRIGVSPILGGLRISFISYPRSTIFHLYDHGDVAEEIPALVPGLDAARPASPVGYVGTSGVGDLVADSGKLPEGGAGAGCAAGFGLVQSPHV